MSKLTKLINSPSVFFKDSINKRFLEPIRQVYYSVDTSKQLSVNKLPAEVSEKSKSMTMAKKKGSS